METNGTAALEPHTGQVDGASERMAAPGQTGTLARFGRWLALMVAVAAMAFTLAGSIAEPAGAAARPNQGTAAERCADMLGNATVYGFFGVNITHCQWDDGHSVWALD